MVECQSTTQMQCNKWVVRKQCARRKLTLQKYRSSRQRKIIILLDQKRVKRRSRVSRSRRRTDQRSLQLWRDQRKSSTVACSSFNITSTGQNWWKLSTNKMSRQLSLWLTMIRKKTMLLAIIRRATSLMQTRRIRSYKIRTKLILTSWGRMTRLLLAMTGARSTTINMLAQIKAMIRLCLIHMKMMSPLCSKLIQNPKQSAWKK